jgi:hypothetical protein
MADLKDDFKQSDISTSLLEYKSVIRHSQSFHSGLTGNSYWAHIQCRYEVTRIFVELEYIHGHNVVINLFNFARLYNLGAESCHDIISFSIRYAEILAITGVLYPVHGISIGAFT